MGNPVLLQSYGTGVLSQSFMQPLTVTLASTVSPTSSLIVVIGTSGSYPQQEFSIANLTGAGVLNWTQVGYQYILNGATFDSWFVSTYVGSRGTNTGSSAFTINWNTGGVDPSNSGTLAILVAEFSNISKFPLSRDPASINWSQDNVGSTLLTASTYTASPSTYFSEIWLAPLGLRQSGSFSNPTQGFSLVNVPGYGTGVTSRRNYASQINATVGLMYKVVSSTGTMSPVATASISERWTAGSVRLYTNSVAHAADSSVTATSTATASGTAPGTASSNVSAATNAYVSGGLLQNVVGSALSTVSALVTASISTVRRPGIPIFPDPLERPSRTLRFANVLGGKAENVPHGGQRVFSTVNSTNLVLFRPSDIGDFSGVVRTVAGKRRAPVPASVNYSRQGTDRFGNPVFPFTGLRNSADAAIPTGSWSLQSTSLSKARSRYAAAYVSGAGAAGTSSFVVVAGGFSGTSPLANVDVWNYPTLNQWSSSSNLPSSKSFAFAVSSLSGTDSQVMIVHGGSGSVSTEGTKTYAFSFPKSAGVVSWSQNPSSSITSKVEAEMIRLNDGRLLSPGGTGLVSGSAALPFTGSELYDPVTGFWTGTLPIPLAPYDRYGYTLTMLFDGSVLMVGGKNTVSAEPYAHTFRFFPNDRTSVLSTSSWSTEQSMSFRRYGHSAVRLNDGRVLVAGGSGGPQANLDSFFPFPMGSMYGSSDAIDDAEIYDPNTGTWSSAGQMRVARTRFMMALIPSASEGGRVIAAGGSDGNTILSSSEVFDVDTMSWTVISSMAVGVRDAKMVVIPSGTFTAIVPGGEASGSSGFFQVSSSQIFTL